MLNDRNYLRQLDDEELIELTKLSDNELAIVLGERLMEAIREIEANITSSYPHETIDIVN